MRRMALPGFFLAATAVFYGLQLLLFRGPFSAVTTGSGAEFLLSAIAQCEAAVIGLVVTTTLVAAQLSASAYMPRAIMLFSRNPDLWLLVVIYTSSMSLALLLLRSTPDSSGLTSILVGISFGSFPAAILTLIPYVTGILRSLDPQRVVEGLSQCLRVSRLRIPGAQHFSPRRKKRVERTLAAVEHLVSASIRRGDFATSQSVFQELTSHMQAAAQSCSRQGDRGNWARCSYFVPRVSRYISRPGRLLAEVDGVLCCDLLQDLLGTARVLFKMKAPGTQEVMQTVSSIGKHAVAFDQRECVVSSLRAIARLGGRVSYLAGRRRMPDGPIDYLRYQSAIEHVVNAAVAIGTDGCSRWGLTFSLDFAECLSEIGVVYARKRPHRRDGELSFFPHSEPIMRVLPSLDLCLVRSFLETDSGLSSYAGEPLLQTRVLDRLQELAHLSFEKGFWADSELSDFGRAVCAISNMGAAASLWCSDKLLDSVHQALQDLSRLRRKCVLRRVEHTMHQHFLLSHLDLERFRNAVYHRLR